MFAVGLEQALVLKEKVATRFRFPHSHGLSIADGGPWSSIQMYRFDADSYLFSLAISVASDSSVVLE